MILPVEVCERALLCFGVCRSVMSTKKSCGCCLFFIYLSMSSEMSFGVIGLKRSSEVVGVKK